MQGYSTNLNFLPCTITFNHYHFSIFEKNRKILKITRENSKDGNCKIIRQILFLIRPFLRVQREFFKYSIFCNSVVFKLENSTKIYSVFNGTFPRECSFSQFPEHIPTIIRMTLGYYILILNFEITYQDIDKENTFSKFKILRRALNPFE